MNYQDLALRSLILVAGAVSALLLVLKGQAQAVPALAIGATLGVPLVGRAQDFKFKLGTDLPVTHSVNVRLKEAIDAIAAETKSKVSIQLFPNNQLGSDNDMMSQIRSGALELATFPGTVMSTLVPLTSIQVMPAPGAPGAPLQV